MKLRSVLLLGLLTIILSGCSKGISQVEIGQSIINVEIADTTQEQYQGLSNRDELCQNCGMLFLVRPDSLPEFVMRDMNFALDFIWINNGQIVDITKQALAEGSSPKTIYQPALPVDYVLEVRAGTADNLGWQVGDLVTLIYE